VTISAVVMVGERSDGASPEGWVQNARRAAAADLLDQLQEIEAIGRILLVTPDAGDLVRAGVEVVTSPPGPVHVGEILAGLVRDYAIDRLLYLGGGAVPLGTTEALAQVVARLAQATGLVITNNRFASDWAGVAPAAALLAHIPRLPRDNMLGWVLSTEGQLAYEALPAVTATRLDIDTPLDLQVLSLHPGAKPRLRAYLEGLPLPLGPLRSVVEVLGTPASHVLIAGRVAPDAWSALNKATRCWLRVLAEERGMVSSGRQGRGEVFSVLGAYIEQVGVDAFFSGLSQWADAALIDTRVLLAQRRSWPGANDRFASDLGWVEAVEDPWLRALTAAAQEAQVPVLFGGHGLMSGALYALAELVPLPAS
jgi:hypothetical protein